MIEFNCKILHIGRHTMNLSEEERKQIYEEEKAKENASPIIGQPKKKKGKLLPIIIGVVVLLMAIGAMGGGEEKAAPTASEPATTAEAQPAPEKDTSISEGMYKIGTDIPAGEYVLIGDGMAYFQVSKDSTGSFDSIICNDNFSNRSIISVKDGQYLSIKNAKGYPYADAPKQEAVDNVLPEGMYKVGVDLPAGEYQLSTDGQGYAEVSKDSQHIMDSILSNDNFSGQKYITVKDGQYLKLTRTSLKLK